MDATTRASALFIAVGIGIAGLYFFRDVLAPFAIAVFLWLIMDGFANAIRRFTFRVIPRSAALAVAMIAVFAGSAAIVAVIANTAVDVAGRASDYSERINTVVAQTYDRLGLEDPPMLGGRCATDEDGAQEDGAAPRLDDVAAVGDRADATPPPTLGCLVGEIPGAFYPRLVGSVRSIASSALFVIIYVVFLFAAQATFPQKMNAIFPEPGDRARAADAIGRVRHSMERYLAVQTFVSLLTAATCYVTLRVLGLDNALFWAFLIFLFNYIPTVGSIVATILPALFALVQYSTLWEPAAVFFGVGVLQFLIGNFIQPRMQGENLNLATVVVLLGLVLWGVIWGLPGMFLSSPLMVTVMVLLAQSRSTRWIAVLLSADGRPDLDPARVTPKA